MKFLIGSASNAKRGALSRSKSGWLSRSTIAVAVALLAITPVDNVLAAQYLNSSEPMCDGSDPTVLMCDDFEDGTWYVTNADTSGGKNNPLNDGWAGNIFADNDGGNAFARCGGLGAVGTNCTATSGQRSGARAEAFHWFAPAETSYDEIYHRFYTRFSPGYKFGHEKLVFYQFDETTNGQVAVLMTPFGNNTFDYTVMLPDFRAGQNLKNNLTFTPGRWYYIEVRIRLDTPMGSGTGLIETWADDCGTAGLGCTGPGTLRQSLGGLNIRRSPSRGLGVIWQENWSNSSNMTAVGEVYNDQVIVRTKRIGPMGVQGPPSNLRVR